MSSGSDFSGVKVGDRLWYLNHEVPVVSINATARYPIQVLGKGARAECFTLEGQVSADGPQVLFWDKVEIVPPPRPKRLVKKTIEVRPYRTMDSVVMVHNTHFNLYDFRMGWKWCGPVQTIEIEVEE